MSLRYKIRITLIRMISHILHILLTARRPYIVNIRGIKFIILRGCFRPDISYSTYLTILGLIRLLHDRRGLLKICETCAGSGMIGIFLSKVFKKCYIVLTDISKIALENAKLNVKTLKVDDRVDIVCTASASAIRDSSFDIAVSNPPYLPCDSYVEICAGSSMNVLREIIIDLFRIVKKGGLVLYTTSSIAPIVIDTVLESVRTPIDTVLLVLCRRS
ncbi:MAG: methyltransferase [Crenarchaeota archaeon]|nr:methyltransferase [Thermoproteota archaeon]